MIIKFQSSFLRFNNESSSHHRFYRKISGWLPFVRGGSPYETGCQGSLPVQFPVSPCSPFTAQGSLSGTSRTRSHLLPVLARRPQLALQPHSESSPAGSRLHDWEEVWWPEGGTDQTCWILPLSFLGRSVGWCHCERERSYKYLWWPGEWISELFKIVWKA